MAIQFRCEHCQTLMSIASRKAGSMVRCAACDEDVLVPMKSPFAAEPLSPPRLGSQTVDEPLDRVALPDDLFDFDEEEGEAKPRATEEFGGLESLDLSKFADHAEDGPIESTPEEERTPPAPAASAPVPRPVLESDTNPFQIQLRKSTIDDEMDLTPMVDVVFQLLIFFMVTASFALHKTIQTPTPESNQKGATQSIQSLEELEGVAILVRIDGQNGIFIDDDPVPDGSPVADALTDKMRKEHKSEIIITADAAAWHRTVVKVVDAANEVGMQKIRLATRSGPAE